MTTLAQVRQVALDLAVPLINNRVVILTGSVARSRLMAQFLSDAGARPTSVELGGAPLETRARFAAYERSLANPDQEIRRRFDEVDPDGTALVYAGSFTAARNVWGRRVVGARTATHVAAEQKHTQRQLLKHDSRILTLGEDLPDVAWPAVVQGIPDDGVAMATSHTYLIPHAPTRHSTTRLAEVLRRDCTRAMVSRFDSGVPCTFYGFITDSHVVNLGPVEALVYWDRNSWRMYAPGILRPLNLANEVLAAAQAEVTAVARRLRRSTGYIGAFGTDGVITDNRYTIHEINPRICAGFSLMDQLATAAAPLAAVDLVLREIPERASEALATPLNALASILSSNTTRAYRLWDTPDATDRKPDGRLSYSDWAQCVRRAAGRGLIHVAELTEPA